MVPSPRDKILLLDDCYCNGKEVFHIVGFEPMARSRSGGRNVTTPLLSLYNDAAVQISIWRRANLSGADKICLQRDRKARLSLSLSCPTARFSSLTSLPRIRRFFVFAAGNAEVATGKRRRSLTPDFVRD
jgi:hypothetical protein